MFVSGFTYLGVHRAGFLVLQVLTDKERENAERFYNPAAAKFLAQAEELKRLEGEEKGTKRRLDFDEASTFTQFV